MACRVGGTVLIPIGGESMGLPAVSFMESGDRMNAVTADSTSRPPGKRSTVPAVLLRIEHINIYRYNRPVEWTTHRLMLRPAESHGLQIRSESLEIHPAHRISWEHDVFYNSVAQVNFTEKADELRIASRYTVQQFNINPFDFVMEIRTNQLPFDYHEDELHDLAPYLAFQHPEDAEAVREWIQPFRKTDGHSQTLDFLLAMNSAIAAGFGYARREEPGIQRPGYTLQHHTGSCRDFALLFMEGARCMGLAARYVSGYLCSEDEKKPDVASDATHAWAEIYLPGAGWKGFDPTCGTLAAGLHVRVAATRNPVQATPIRGSYLGDASLFRGMDVSVHAHVLQTSSQSQS